MGFDKTPINISVPVAAGPYGKNPNYVAACTTWNSKIKDWGKVGCKVARPEQNFISRPALCGAHSLMPQVNTGSRYRCGE